MDIKEENSIQILEEYQEEEKSEDSGSDSNDRNNEESAQLINKEEKKEKEELKKIINEIQNELNNPKYETLNHIYEQYINNDDIKQNEIKPNTKRSSLCFMFYIVSPSFSIINLIGIFESISIMNIIFQILKNAIISYFNSMRKDKNEITSFSIDDFNKKYNFYNMFFDQIKKDPFDFNLMMFTAFLGDILLKLYNFIFPTVIFAIVNSISFLLILSFSFPNYSYELNTFEFFRILHLLLCYIILLIGVGASALLSQQIIIDTNYQYNKYLLKLNEETQKMLEEREEKSKLIKKDEEIKNDNQESNQNKLLDKDNGNEIILISTDEKEKNENKENDKNNNDEIKNIIENEEELKVKKEKNKEEKINSKKEEKNYRESHNKFDSFFTICITIIIAYLLKYFINIIIMEQKNLKIDKYMEYVGCINDTNCYEKIIKDNNFSKLNESLFQNLIKTMNDDSVNYFYIIIIIYTSSISVSCLLYFLFTLIFTGNKEKKKKPGDSYKVCEICGYTIYSQDRVLIPKPFKGYCCLECCLFNCIICRSCLNMGLNSFFTSIFCFGKTEKKEDDEDECNCDCLINCCCCCCCCCLLSNIEEDTLEKRSQFFCYCYQTKRKLNCFYKYLTSDVQKTIFPYMMEYFILKILTIAFEKQYFDFEDNNEPYNSKINNNNYSILKNKDIFTILTFAGTFFLFIYFSFSFHKLVLFFSNGAINKKNKMTKTSKLSNQILYGTHGILIFDGIFALIFSSLYISHSDHGIFKSIHFYLVPVLMNKFYYLTLIYYCISYSEEKKKFDIISGSTLISIYIFIGNTIISLIGDSLELKSLYIIQIVFASFACLFVIFIILFFIIFMLEKRIPCNHKLTTLFCCISFIVCCGGFWFDGEIYGNISECKCKENKCKCEKCCINASYCWYDFINFFGCPDCCYCNNCCRLCCINCCHCFTGRCECCEDCYKCCENFGKAISFINLSSNDS